MKKLSLIFSLLISLASFSQTSLSYRYQVPSQLNDGLQTARLFDVGIDSGKIIDLTNKILSGTYTNIHSLLILRDNKLVYENYFPGYENSHYGDSSIINHDRGSIHECRSISKSLVSACIGIAISQGRSKA